ncbi:MAG: type II toxin-antitoxin system death-on-curing family toxin [Bacteroidota bacterium]
MIILREALIIHQILIDRFGGSSGIRDQALLESALNRPYATFDGQELYPSPEEKASAIIESILINHPFTDGNKRTGYTLMRLLLMSYHKDIKATEEEKYDFVINIASSKYQYEDILEWIRSKLKNK